jgi:ribosome-binding factor A
MASVKIERLQKMILHDVQEIVAFRLRDPRLKFGSVTQVKLSEDLHHAKIFVSCLGSEADRRTYLRGLDSAKGKIQSIVAKHLKTRVTPRLAFAYDEGLERSIRVSEIIEKALTEDDEARAARGEAPHRRLGEEE